MSISLFIEKIKHFPQKIHILAITLLVFSSYGSGILYESFSKDNNILYIKSEKIFEESKEISNKTNIVASKNGTRYYFLWCSGVSRIKSDNLVYFETVEEAQKTGLKPAQNCPGLE
jgi:hypothetical protein